MNREDDTTLDLRRAIDKDDDAIRRAVEQFFRNNPNLAPARFGLAHITDPLTFFMTVESIRMLIGRLVTQGPRLYILSTSDCSINESYGRPAHRVARGTRDIVVGEISHCANVSAATAERLANWFVVALRTHGALLAGYRATATGVSNEHLVIQEYDNEEDELAGWQPALKV